MIRITTVAAALATTAAAASASTTIVIDDYTDLLESEDFITSAGSNINAIGSRSGLDAGFLALPNGASVGDPFTGFTFRASETQNQSGLAGVLGGERSGTVTANPNSARVNVSIGFGAASMNHNAGASGIAEFDYTNVNLDLTSGDIGFDLLSGDLDQVDDQFDRPVDVTLSLTDGLGASHDVTQQILAVQRYDWDIADFANAGVDLSDIDSIGIKFDASAVTSTDFSWNNLSFNGVGVPTPGTAGIAALAGIAATRRRR